MPRPEGETQLTTEDGELPSEFPLLEKLVNYVKEDNPEVLKNELFTKVKGNQAIDADGLELLERAITFMENVHEGQPRKYNHQIEIKPFITHTLATALMVYEVMGNEITADALAVALLHDAIEDGKIAEDGKKEKRNVRKSDLTEKGGFSQRIADAVEALSNVRDIEISGEFIRRKLTGEEYAASILTGITKDPKLKIATIKICDRSTNTIDPFSSVEQTPGLVYPTRDAFSSRQNHIENTKKYLVPMVAGNQKVGKYIHDVIDLANLTCTPEFNPREWQKQLSKFQSRPK